MNKRTAQILLLTTALVLGLAAPVFNGASLLALVLVTGAGLIALRSRRVRQLHAVDADEDTRQAA
ncbi:hypothetical protein V6N00_13530 [Tersicoccus sp. MR15.9]|uniref:hypothetical protein n=1 Tax=Tersicoccus mangrovi TaxID=3121635 RepID=UPI002FE56BB4